MTEEKIAKLIELVDARTHATIKLHDLNKIKSMKVVKATIEAISTDLCERDVRRKSYDMQYSVDVQYLIDKEELKLKTTLAQIELEIKAL